MIRTLFYKIVSIILFPLTVFMFLAPIIVYVLPFLDKSVVLAMIRGELMLLMIIFIFSIFFLSAYCGYLCPITKLFNLIAIICKDKSILSYKFPKVVGTVTQTLWITTVIYVITRHLGNCFGFLSKAEIYSRWEVIVFFSLYGGAAVLSRTRIGKDELGHYLCFLSIYIKLSIKLNDVFGILGYRLILDSDKCIDCKLCNKVCLYQNDVREMVKTGIIDYNICSNCGKCISVCKERVIVRKWV